MFVRHARARSETGGVSVLRISIKYLWHNYTNPYLTLNHSKRLFSARPTAPPSLATRVALIRTALCVVQFAPPTRRRTTLMCAHTLNPASKHPKPTREPAHPLNLLAFHCKHTRARADNAQRTTWWRHGIFRQFETLATHTHTQVVTHTHSHTQTRIIICVQSA